MARFDVYRNPAGAGCLLDIQADLLSHLNTRVVVPSNNMSLAH
jgi:toxin CcdB